MTERSVSLPAAAGVVERTAAHLGGSGPPLVLLHGVDMSWPAWSPVIPLLEQKHTVFAPTLAGHRGGPPIPAGSAGIGPIADALERQLDDLGWPRAHFAGNSLGGWLAVEMAQRGRALSATAFSPAGAFASRWAARRLELLMHILRRLGGLRGVERLARFQIVRFLIALLVVHDPRRVTAEEAVELLRDLRACTALTALAAGIKTDGPLAFSVDPALPIRIAWARRDRLIPWRGYGVPFCALLPSAEQVTLDGVGHVPMSDDPHLVADTILAVTERM